MQKTLKERFFNLLNLRGILRQTVGEFSASLLGINYLDRKYQEILSNKTDNFVDDALNKLNISISVTENDLLKLPKNGGGIVVANHPFGGIEGLMISSILSKVRPDYKILANNFLKIFPELSNRFIFVDIFKGENAKSKNSKAIREAIKFVQNGGILVVFPAGVVSHYQLQRKKISDPEWQKNIGRMIEKLQVPVYPIFFNGQNSVTFQFLGMIHPIFRTLRLPIEFINKQNKKFDIVIGKAILPEKLENLDSTKERLEYLRKKTYSLKNKISQSLKNEDKKNHNIYAPIAKDIEKSIIKEDFERIPTNQILFKQKESVVFYAYAFQIPNLLQQIGIEREKTFRVVNEGTGLSIDLDNFDNHYVHLIAIDLDVYKIVGAYRLGLSDRIITDFGIYGFYTSTLFKIKKKFFDIISPSIEMGRSFITQDYQKKYNSLYLLWRGIGVFISLHPQYRYLFGPVTISNAYHPLSQKLMLEYLKVHHNNSELKNFIKPRTGDTLKIKLEEITANDVAEIKEVEDLIKDLDPNYDSMPILIKQYLKLGAKFLSFNRDMKFGSALDGLIVVDLIKTDTRILRKYFTDDGVQLLHDYHKDYSQLKERAKQLI